MTSANGTPHAAKAVLCLALSEPEQANAVVQAVEHRWLTGSELRVFGAIERLTQGGSVANVVTVSDELKKCGDLDGIGGHKGIAEIVDFDSADPRALPTYVATLRDDWMRRELASLGIDPGVRATADVIADVQGKLEGLAAAHASGLPEATRVLELGEDKPPAWAVKPYILRGDINFKAGDGAAWKTTQSLLEAGAIACGQMVAGHFETTEGPVLYVSGEDGQGRIRNRVRAIARGHQWSLDKLDNLYVLARCGVSLDVPEWRQHLLRTAERLGVVAVYFDPLRDLTAAELNSDKEVAPLNRFFRELCELPSEPAVVVVHHAGKMTEGKRTIDRVRGSSALNQAARSILFLSRTSHGVQVEHLKCTDAAPHPTFIVETKITEHENFPGLWETAHFNYHSKREGDQQEAEAPVLEFIRRNPGLTTTQIRELAPKEYKSLRLSGISDAMKALRERDAIRFQSGPKNSRLWEVVE